MQASRVMVTAAVAAAVAPSAPACASAAPAGGTSTAPALVVAVVAVAVVAAALRGGSRKVQSRRAETQARHGWRPSHLLFLRRQASQAQATGAGVGGIPEHHDLCPWKGRNVVGWAR